MFGKEKDNDKGKKFEIVRTQGAIMDISIIVDKETGVNYLFVANIAEEAGGLTSLLNADGSIVVTKDYDM